MGFLQGIVSLAIFFTLFFVGTADAIAQSNDPHPSEKPTDSKPSDSKPSDSKPSDFKPQESKSSGAKTFPKSPRPSAGVSATRSCPPPNAALESATRLRLLSAAVQSESLKIKIDKNGLVAAPVTGSELAPATNQCFFVLGDNQQDVVAELIFQKISKTSKGTSAWFFSAVRRAETSGKSLLNLSVVKASDVTLAKSADMRVNSKGGVVIPGENPLVLPAVVWIQNAVHQAANVRSGVALNIPVSGFGFRAETFAPRMKAGLWTNALGLRVNYSTWGAAKFGFKKPKNDEVQDGKATGSNLQIDTLFRYPMNLGIWTRLGFFVSPYSTQTEILKISAGTSSPENKQTLTRRGILFGLETELQPTTHVFLTGLFAMSVKEKVTVTDESEPGEKLSGTGGATRLHVTGVVGIRLPLEKSQRFIFEGLVGNTYRSDKYSGDIAYAEQSQQKDILTFFQAGFGYIF